MVSRPKLEQYIIDFESVKAYFNKMILKEPKHEKIKTFYFAVGCTLSDCLQ